MIACRVDFDPLTIRGLLIVHLQHSALRVPLAWQPAPIRRGSRLISRLE